MYVTEALGKLASYREPPISMAVTYLRKPTLGPISHPPWLVRPGVKPPMVCHCSVEAKPIGEEVFSVTSSSKYDVDYLGESTKGDLNVKLDQLESFGILTKLEFPSFHHFTKGDLNAAFLFFKYRFPPSFYSIGLGTVN